MALDVGEKTIGVAFCEEGTTLAFPGKTLWRQAGKKRDMAALRQLIADNDVHKIVVGLPLQPDGTTGPQAARVEAFLTTLRNNVRIPIMTQDERLSTQEAAELLLAANRRPAEHKQTIDSVAAALILQWHLEEGGREEEKKRRREEKEAIHNPQSAIANPEHLNTRTPQHRASACELTPNTKHQTPENLTPGGCDV